MSVCLENNNVPTSEVSAQATVSQNAELIPVSTEPSAQSIVSPASSSVQPLTITHMPENSVLEQKPSVAQLPQPLGQSKTITKLLVANHQAAVVGANSPVLQKLNSPVITVLNSAGGPLTVLKTICVTSSVPAAPHFSLVNNQTLTVTNSLLGKSPTITLINAPLSVVKVGTPQTQNQQGIPQAQHHLQVQPLNQQSGAVVQQNASVINLLSNVEKVPEGVLNVAPVSNNASTIIENRAHNVFVKNTCPELAASEVSQCQKILTTNNFSQANVLAGTQTSAKPVLPNNVVATQKGKLKVLGNVIVPSQITTTSLSTQQQISSNVIINKVQTLQQPPKVIPRHKIVSGNVNNAAKFVNKPVSSSNTQNIKPVVSNVTLPGKYPQEKSTLQNQSRLMYPTHKSQIKTIPPVSNFAQKPQGIKTLSPQPKTTVPGHVQRTGTGVRTIPPQRPQKMVNKPNYIGKHAVQAQKMKTASNNRYNKTGSSLKEQSSSMYNSYMPPINDKQLTFNQALTAEILETLSNKSSPNAHYPGKGSYEILPNRIYDGSYLYNEQKSLPDQIKYEDKSKSGLDALSLICQAVLLDHNYNATLPPDSPTRLTPMSNSPQLNGVSSNATPMFSPGTNKRRTLSASNPVSTSSSSISLIPSNSNSLINLQDDDAGSEISDCSDRKHDTEGEETDTAPEAEAVTNDEAFDHYGDYVTRCICGFLHDDGYMVECDRCKVWQHVQCVVKNRQVPDEYLCEMCDPTKPIDSHKARLIQQQWLREKLPELKLRKDNKLKEPGFKQHKEPLSDTDSSDAENPRHNNNTVSSKGRVPGRKKSEIQRNSKPKKEISKDVPPRKQMKKREKKFIKRKTRIAQKQQNQQQQQQHHEEDNHADSFSTMHLPQLRQWIENYEEAVTNHYSPELRARISSIRVNGQHSDNPQPVIAYDTNVCKCRVHTQPLTEIRYLVSTHSLQPDSPVIELRGKYMLSTQHRNNAGSVTLTTRQHAQRPGPFLFFYRLSKDNTEVCVDTRTYGNAARFIRRSCRPNAELRHCIEKGVLHLYVVTIASVQLGQELTIKHESHDLAAAGTTHIACYCGLPQDECKINNRSANNTSAPTLVKRNGESSANNNEHGHRKRRGRRTTSVSANVEIEIPKIKQEVPETLTSPVPQEIPQIKMEVIEDDECIKQEVEIKEEPKEEIQIKEEKVEIKEERPVTPKKELEESSSEAEVKTPEKKEKKSHPTTPISTRRSSHHKNEKSGDKEPVSKQEKSKSKKLSREERKLEAILRAIEQMEKADQKKQEHKHTTKQVHRRESEPSPAENKDKEDEKIHSDQRMKRKRRKGRARTVSTNSTRRDRLNSADSYVTSSDEVLLSPNDGVGPTKPNKSVSSADESRGPSDNSLLMTVTNEDKCDKSPVRDIDMSSNPSDSPETPLSFACSLVQAAVEPLEAGFKFPKTKKGLMNEWLNKTPEPSLNTLSPLSPHIQTSEYDSLMGFYGNTKNFSNLINEQQQSQTEPKGSAKKRWLRQAISEDKNDNIHSCSDSPPLSDSVAPPKKRKLPRESISNDNSPPSTPTGLPLSNLDAPREGCVEIVYNGPDGDSPGETLESDAILKERAAEMKQEFGKCLIPPPTAAINEIPQRPNLLSFGCLMDPRLARNRHMLNSDQLVGTVEKTLSILGFNDRKPDPITPIKRKLSITEYRQRKKVPANENSDNCEKEDGLDECLNEENNSSESFKPCRTRLNSNSTSTSLSSDDEVAPVEVVAKVPAFNSEPTELERQREISNIRLKKAFGLSIDVEPRKPALNVEAILNCEIPMPDVQIPLQPSHTIPDISVPTISAQSVPVLKETRSPTQTENVQESIEDDSRTSFSDEKQMTESLPSLVDAGVEKMDDEDIDQNDVINLENKNEDDVVNDEEKPELEVESQNMKPHMFYTPDEEEDEDENIDNDIPEMESVNYVPPFNNPIYPSNNFSSVIDEEGRYEGRNPSPPPNLDSIDHEH